MKIYVYTCTDAPPAARALARLIGPKGAPPIHTLAASEAEARDKMQAAWDGWIAKAEAARNGKFPRKVTPEQLIEEQVGQFEKVDLSDDEDLDDLLS